METPETPSPAAATPPSDHFDGRCFFNTDPEARHLHGLSAVLKWRLQTRPARWPRHVDNVAVPAVATAVAPGEVVVTAINHATLLVQVAGLNVLTDPVFSERASPVGFAGPRRVRAPGITLAALPPIDIVLVSHNHYDHLDLASIAALWQQHRPLFVVPLGNAALLRGVGVTRVVELDWWQAHDLPGGATVTAVEVQHWSARGIRDRNRALWAGFVVHAGGTRVYFAGDSGYGDHFVRARTQLGPMDVALLPIGAYAPRWFMRCHHMDPDDAVRAHLDLGAAQSVGIHWGTFQLTDEPMEEPPQRLAQALRAQALPAEAFVALTNGQTLPYRQVPGR